MASRSSPLLTVLALLLLLILAGCGSQAASRSIFIGESAASFVDPSGLLSIEEILSRQDALFVPSEGEAPNRGVPQTKTTAFWVKVTIPETEYFAGRNWSDQIVLSIAEPRIREASLFVADGGAIETRRWSSADGRRAAGEGFRYPVFFLERAEIEGETLYLRIHTQSSMRAMVWLADLQSFIARYDRETLSVAILVGVMIGILVYVSALGLNLRDPTNLWLGLCIFSTMLYILCNNAIFETRLFPGAVTASRILSLSATLVIYASFIAFMARFLRLGEVAPRINRVAVGAAWFFAVVAILSAIDIWLGIGVARNFSPYFGLAALLFAFLTTIVTFRRGPLRATFFLVAWTPSVIGGMARILLDVVPGMGASPAATNSVFFGVAASLVLFSVIAAIDIQMRQRALKAEIVRNFDRFRAFAEIGTDVFWEIDRENRLTFLSGRQIGPAAFSVGEPFLDQLATATSRDFVAPIASAVAEKRRIDDRRLRMIDGERDVWISLSGRPIAPPAGEDDKAAVYRGLIKDVTEETERESRRLHEQQMFALGQLTGSVAHEINNLIHPIINLTKRLRQKSRGSADADTEKMIELIDVSSRQAASVVSELLSTTRAEKWQNVDRPIDVAVRHGVDSVRPALPSTVRLDIALTEIDGVSVKVGDVLQILGNLVSNAVHAMNGSGTISVSLGQEPSGAARLSVADNGAGMDEEVRRKALQPFFTTKTNGGTGVGLYVVQRIMREYGGGIAVDSAPGSGTTINLVFPRREEDNAGKQSSRAGG